MQKVWNVFQCLTNNIMNWDFIPKLSSVFFILIDNDAEDVGFGIDDAAQERSYFRTARAETMSPAMPPTTAPAVWPMMR